MWNKWTRQSVPAWLQPFSPTSMRANMNRNKNSPQHRLTFATSTSWSITVAAMARLHKHVFTEKKNYQQNNTRWCQCMVKSAVIQPSAVCLLLAKIIGCVCYPFPSLPRDTLSCQVNSSSLSYPPKTTTCIQQSYFCQLHNET